MEKNKIIATVIVLLVLLFGSNFFFTVNERESAILLALGKLKRTNFEPGIYFRVPLFNEVLKFDRRVLTLDAKPEQILTGEKKNVMVDYFVKWRITNVEQYFRSFGGREADAASRMAQTIKDGLQAELGNRTIREVVSGERKEIMKNVADLADSKMKDFGVMIVDVRIKQIELPRNVRDSVFDRMRAERLRIANEHRAMGEKESLIIRARADRDRTEILARAKRKAEEIRGSGDGKATAIYAQAYSKDAGFYDFYRSLQAYRRSFNNENEIMVLQPDSEFFRYFKQTKPKK